MITYNNLFIELQGKSFGELSGNDEDQQKQVREIFVETTYKSNKNSQAFALCNGIQKCCYGNKGAFSF